MGFQKMDFHLYAHYSIIPTFQYPSPVKMQFYFLRLERIFYEDP